MINNYVTITGFIQSHLFSCYMASTAVLLKPTITTTAMIATTNNNLSAYIANNSVVNSAFFFRHVLRHGSTKHQPFDSHDRSSDHQHRTFSHSNDRNSINSSHSFSLSVFFSNFTVPVAAYFSLPTGLAARETERIVDPIRPVFFSH